MTNLSLQGALDRARGIVEASVAAGELAGAVGLIGQGADHEVFSAGARALDASQAMRSDDLFRIASMTKPITAAAAMMLIEEGVIALGEPVDRLLPELAGRRVLRCMDSQLDDTVPAARPITVEDVMTFRLGFGVVLAPPGAYPIQKAIADLELPGFGPPDPSYPHGGAEWVRRLASLPLMAQPGERWLYTTGSNLLGVLIERASGRTLPEFLCERLFAPLGMKDTAFHVDAPKAGRLTAAYRPTPDRLVLYDDPARSAYAPPPAFPAGDSGLISTAADFFAFARLLMAGGRTGAGRLLSDASAAAMTRNHLTPTQRAGDPILGPFRGWGYGLAVVMDKTPEGVPAGAFGWNGGLGTSWVSDPASGLTAILLTQTLFQNPHGPPVHRAFQSAVFGGEE